MKTDFGKFRRLCQLEKLLKVCFVGFFLASCSHEVIIEAKPEVPIKPSWLKVEKMFALRGPDETYLTHPFFDIPFDLNKDAEIRYFTITPMESKYQYNIDLLSGSLYKVRDFCESRDVWESFDGKIFTPNFDIGIIPQAYDELGDPQRILIFRNKVEKEKFNYSVTTFKDARILGAIQVEKCDSFPCNIRDRWKPSQILIGVNKDDPDFDSIESLTDLKGKVDWKYTRAFLNNNFGTHQLGEKFFPAYRINNEIAKEETVRNFTKKVRVIKMDAELEYRDSCIDLYKEMWANFSRIRALEADQQIEFIKYFKTFYAKDSVQFYQCQKVVRPANINEDPERHWFFAYLSAFTNLERAGLYYSCFQKGWAYNPKVDDDHFYVDQNKEINRCRPREFEKSFDQAINGLSLLKNQLNKFFRYLEYDSSLGGTHQRIYSWIMGDVKKLSCEKPRTDFEVFPQDVVWQPFKEDEKETVH